MPAASRDVVLEPCTYHFSCRSSFDFHVFFMRI